MIFDGDKNVHRYVPALYVDILDCFRVGLVPICVYYQESGGATRYASPLIYPCSGRNRFLGRVCYLEGISTSFERAPPKEMTVASSSNHKIRSIMTISVSLSPCGKRQPTPLSPAECHHLSSCWDHMSWW